MQRHGTVKRTELNAFLFLTVVLWPVLAVAIAGTYGLIVWNYYQMILGPPERLMAIDVATPR